MKIGIDLDGVVYDIISPFDKFIKVQRYLNKITNIEYARREK